MSSNIPSLPPWDICGPGSNISPAVSEWLCENYYWPAVHWAFGFIVQHYTGKWWISLFITYIFESLEAVTGILSGTLLGDPLESVGGMLISDILVYFIGIVMNILFRYILDYHYSVVPQTVSEFKEQWSYLFIQFTIYFLATFIYWLPPAYFSDGVISWGALVINLIFPVTFYLFSVWNRHSLPIWSHTRHIKVTYYGDKNVPSNENSTHNIQNNNTLLTGNYISYRNTPKYVIENRKKKVYVDHVYEQAIVSDNKYRRVHIILSLYIFAFMATFQVRYTSVFIMLLFHSAFILIVLSIVAIMKTYNYYNPMKRNFEKK
jgi:hypothetical protein